MDPEKLFEETIRAIVMVGGIAVGLRYAAGVQMKGGGGRVVEVVDDLVGATIAAMMYAYSESLFVEVLPTGLGNRVAGLWIAMMIIRWASRITAKAKSKEVHGPFG